MLTSSVISKSEIYEAYLFNQRVKEVGESFDSFLIAVRSLAKTYNFSTIQDQMIRGRDSGKKCFWNKERSPTCGLAWEVIVNSLNEIHSPKFQLKDKKAVRERCNLLRKKFSKMMSEEKRQV